jgi:hypothetical protein
MGVTLRCGKKTMSLPYSTWNKFRECLFLLARQYIMDQGIRWICPSRFIHFNSW